MGKATKPNGATRKRPKHPDLSKATPEALAKALLRPKAHPQPANRGEQAEPVNPCGNSVPR